MQRRRRGQGRRGRGSPAARSSSDRRGESAENGIVVAGGGPAGVVLGLLLARAGRPVTVVEKHTDFLRDFRGDTVHPSTLDLLEDLGLLDEIAEVPHSVVTTFDAVVGGVRFTPADVRRVGRSGELWFMPQWDLLTALVAAAERHPSFTLVLGHAVTGVVEDGGRVTGVTLDDGRTLAADLVVAADGRWSTVREAAGLTLAESGPPVDVLWFRVPRPAVEPPDTIAYVARDVVVTIPRPGYYQTALLIPKGTFPAVRAAGLAAFRERVAATVPFLASSLEAVDDWGEVKLLDVRIACAPVWHRPGLLLIGDAAHPMSPVFGVGIEYAIQDAVATARLLLEGDDPDAAAAAVEERRLPPTRRMQRLQRIAHRTIARPHDRGLPLPPRWLLRIVLPIVAPIARRRLSPIIGLGFLPEPTPPADAG